MKLYYLTSNLNIDNILTSECVSPYLFYTKQNFGYRRIEMLPELSPVKDHIILFSEIPNFAINDDNRENHPMILEIEDDTQLSEITKLHEYNGCEVFAYHRTIYLTPWNCSILFFTQKAYVLSKTKCLDSSNNKHFSFYRMKVVSPAAFSLADVMAKCPGPQENYNLEHYVSLDNSINKAKGFIYGFFIGRTKSVSHNTAKLQQIQRRVYDIVASVKSNGGQSTQAFIEELCHLNKEYSKYDKNSQTARELWHDEVKAKLGCDSSQLEAFLKEYGVLSDIMWKFCTKNGIRIRKSCEDVTNLSGMTKLNDSVSADVNTKVSVDNQKMRFDFSFEETIAKLNYDYPFLFLNGCDKDTDLYNKILKNIFWDNIIPSFEYLRTNRFDCATEVTKVIKSILEENGEEWESSEAKTYFNALRKNIKNYDPFDVNQTDNNVFKSIATFILKGESFDAMDTFIKVNAIERCDYAFGLWGAMAGYASVSRAYTDTIVKDKAQYLNEYVSIQRLVLNNVWLGSEWPLIEHPLLPRHEEEPKNIATFLSKELSNRYHNPKVDEVLEKAAALEEEVQCPMAFMMILNNLISIKSNTYKLLKEAGLYEDDGEYTMTDLRKKILDIIGQKEWKKNKDKIEQALELEGRRQDPEAFAHILDDFLDRNSKTYKKIIELLSTSPFFGVSHKSTNATKQTEIEFPRQMQSIESTSGLQKEGLQSNLHSSVILQIRCLAVLDPKIIRRLEQNWDFTEKKYPEDRQEHIRYFINLCKKEGRGEAPKATSLLHVFTKEIASEVEKELKEYYHV